MPSRDKNLLDSRLLIAWVTARQRFMQSHPDIEPFLTCTYRSPEEQNELYAQGRTAPGHIVTNAKAGESPHNYLPTPAMDVAFRNIPENTVNWDSELFIAFNAVLQTIYPEIVWGGNWKSIKDNPHWETHDWKKLK